MAILVTGGAGYIGSHTCVELLNEGHEVVAVDNFSNSKQEALKRVQEITGRKLKFYGIDISDRKGLEKVFLQNKIDAVIHFAGLKAIGESVDEPLRYYQNNIIGTLTLLELMQRFGVKKMVFSSSAAVYGAQKSVPISEDFPLYATNPYGHTKLMIEKILSDLYISDNEWSIVLLRYFNPIGAHESGKIGEDPKGVPNNLMPYITKVAAGKLDKLSVFGGDYDTTDGTGIRDYIHVVDLARGHLKALERIMSIAGIDAFNLGTGMGYSVLDILKSFEEATGRKIPYIITKRRPGDVGKSYANIGKAKEKLNWCAEKTILDMCRDSWNWQVNNPDGYEKVSDMEASPASYSFMEEIAVSK